MSIYTYRERTELKFTINDAIELAAKRNSGRGICLDSIKNRSKDERITYEQLNELIESVVDDSEYYN